MPRLRLVLPLLVSCAVIVTALSCSGGDGGSPTTPTENTASKPAQVLVSPGSDTLNWIGATRQMGASVLNSTGETLNVSVTWTSTATNVASVSAAGLVSAVGVGTTSIVAQAGTVSGTATIVVRQVPATITKVSGDSQTGTLGEILGSALVIEVKDQGGAVAAGAKLTWNVTQGGGKLESGSTETDASGRGQASWRLGSTVGGQALQVSAGSLSSVTFNAVGAAPPVASVELLPVADTVTAIGDTARFVAKANAANGAEVPGAAFTFTASDGSVASVSATGLATARAAGSSKIIAQSGAKADTSTFVVAIAPAGPVIITSVQPTPLVEGQAATIQGAGFSTTAALNTVKVDGFAATVTSASATELRITVPYSDCRPARQGTVSVTVGSGSASANATISPERTWKLDLGYAVYGSQCLHLDRGSASEKYLVGIYSLSETPSSLTAALLSSRTGAALEATISVDGRLGVALRPGDLADQMPDSPGGLSMPNRERLIRHRQAEAIRRGQDAATLRPLLEDARAAWGRRAPWRAPAAASSVGDTVTVNFRPDNGACSTVIPVRSVVRHVGVGAVWLEDVGNPTVSFTTAEYQQLDQQYANTTHAVLTSYFGVFRDIDGNGKTLILLTRKVNEMKTANGFVDPADLYPKSVCARSNEAEIFYGIVPDPAGVVGDTLSKATALDMYPSLMAHEITHILQETRIIHEGAADKKTWEIEGGATLAEQLVGFRVMGHSTGQDLGYSAWNAGGRWYEDWAYDLAVYFGYSATGHVAGAPEQCSWVGRESEGNSGPCGRARAPYGTPSTLLRLILDRWGGTYPGGEAALMRQLTSSGSVGLDNLAAATGERKDWILSLFGMTLWGDGRFGNFLSSWNIHDVLRGFVAAAQLQPYTYSGAAPTLSVSVRAGSQAFLEWTPPAGHSPTSLRITTTGGSTLPSNMGMWVLRIR
ncbi:MAG: hypothetical protein AMXMBFR53_08000 [Gemmatimonadota bacterium]